MTAYGSWTAQQLKAAATGVDSGPLRALAKAMDESERAAIDYCTRVRSTIRALSGDWTGDAAVKAFASSGEAARAADDTGESAAALSSRTITFADTLAREAAEASRMPAPSPPDFGDYLRDVGIFGVLGGSAAFLYEAHRAEQDRLALVAKVESIDQAGVSAGAELVAAVGELGRVEGFVEPPPSLDPVGGTGGAGSWSSPGGPSAGGGPMAPPASPPPAQPPTLHTPPPAPPQPPTPHSPPPAPSQPPTPTPPPPPNPQPPPPPPPRPPVLPPDPPGEEPPVFTPTVSAPPTITAPPAAGLGGGFGAPPPLGGVAGAVGAGAAVAGLSGAVGASALGLPTTSPGGWGAAPPASPAGAGLGGRPAAPTGTPGGRAGSAGGSAPTGSGTAGSPGARSAGRAGTASPGTAGRAPTGSSSARTGTNARSGRGALGERGLTNSSTTSRAGANAGGGRSGGLATGRRQRRRDEAETLTRRPDYLVEGEDVWGGGRPVTRPLGELSEDD